MRQKLSLLLTLIAWLFATGSQLDVVQTFAWIRMFTANAQEMSVAAAFERTFSPEGRCHLCVAVAQARQQQEDAKGIPTVEKAGAKIVLIFQPTPEVLLGTDEVDVWPAWIETACSAGRAAPPLPPPRGFAA